MSALTVELERGHRPRLREPARDRLADVRERARLDLAARRRCAGGAAAAPAAPRARSTSSATMRPSGPVPRELREIDAALARDAPRERRRLDAAVRRPSLDGRLAACACGDPASAAGAGARPSVPRLAGASRRRRRSRRLGDLLALVADEADRLADLDLALGDRDLQQHAGRLGLDLLRHLVGVELVERLALLDRLALGLQPLDDRPGLHALAEPRQLDLGRHVTPSC